MVCVAPAPGALIPSQPLFSKRTLAPDDMATSPFIRPVLTMTLPDAEGPVEIA
jgi:hypothetical protein